MHTKNQDYTPIYQIIERVKELEIFDEEHIKEIMQTVGYVIDAVENPDKSKLKIPYFTEEDLSYIAYLDNEYNEKMKALIEQANSTNDHAELDKIKEEATITYENYNNNRQTFFRNLLNKILLSFFKYAVSKPSKSTKLLIPLIKQLRLSSQIAGDKDLLEGYENMQNTLSNALELKEAMGIEDDKLPPPQEDKTQKISLLFDYLSKQNCIDISYQNDFVSLFTNNVSKRAIKWKNGERLLIHLIETMMTNQYYSFVADEDLFQFIERSFVNKKAKPFLKKQLQIVKASQKIKNDNLISERNKGKNLFSLPTICVITPLPSQKPPNSMGEDILP